MNRLLAFGLLLSALVCTEAMAAPFSDPMGEEAPASAPPAAEAPTSADAPSSLDAPAPPDTLGEWQGRGKKTKGASAEHVLAVATEASQGCATYGGPLAACGIGAAGTGVLGILGIFTLGLPTQVGLCGFAIGACVGVPALFALGPCSVLGAGMGVNKASPRPDAGWLTPAMLAGLPAAGLALVGSVAAFIGTTLFIAAFLGQDGAQMRAAGALISVGALTNAVVGPATVLGAMVLDAAMELPEESEGTKLEVETARGLPEEESGAVASLRY